MMIRNLRISTKLKLHPDFVAEPHVFARQVNIDIMGDYSPKVDFRKSQTPSIGLGNSRDEIFNHNFHLEQHRAIKLFSKTDKNANSDGFEDNLHSIQLNPS